MALTADTDGARHLEASPEHSLAPVSEFDFCLSAGLKYRSINSSPRLCCVRVQPRPLSTWLRARLRTYIHARSRVFWRPSLLQSKKLYIRPLRSLRPWNMPSCLSPLHMRKHSHNYVLCWCVLGIGMHILGDETNAHQSKHNWLKLQLFLLKCTNWY